MFCLNILLHTRKHFDLEMSRKTGKSNFVLGKLLARSALDVKKRDSVFLCLLRSLTPVFLETENAERLIQSMMKVIQAGLM